MEGFARSSAEKGKTSTLKDPSPAGQQPDPSAEVRCIQAIQILQDHDKTPRHHKP